MTLREFETKHGKAAADAIRKANKLLLNRNEHPRGKFDNAGRFYLEYRDISTSRNPSRAYPYSELNEGRGKPYLMRLWEHCGCQSESDLFKVAFSD